MIKLYCDDSITIMRSLKVFINDYLLACRQVKVSLVK